MKARDMQDCLLGHGHQAVGSASGREEYHENALYASDGRRDILRPEPDDADSVKNDRV